MEGFEPLAVGTIGITLDGINFGRLSQQTGEHGELIGDDVLLQAGTPEANQRDQVIRLQRFGFGQAESEEPLECLINEQ